MTRLRFVATLSTLAVAPLAPVTAQTPLWTRQIGTSTEDTGYGVAVDGTGNAYITGYTYGSLGGPNAGGRDAFLAKYDASGTPLWTRQVGTPEYDRGAGVAVDSAGNAYVTGTTYGSLGGPNAGVYDIFLAKYDASGTPLWTRQVGTPYGDFASGVAVDSAGNAYVTGTIYDSGEPNADPDALLAKFDASGTPLWTRQVGTPYGDFAYGVDVDSAGNAYITGTTYGSLGGPNAGGSDIFLAKYDASGNPLWTRQATGDSGSGVAVDSAGNAYITGTTYGSFGGPTGLADIFLAKYDASGTPLWTHQVGTKTEDQGAGVAVDSAGNAYITGGTNGSLGGPNAGVYDIFLAKYDASGTPLWTRQVGTPYGDFAYGVAVDSAGNAYIAGETNGSLGGHNAGESDIFLAKYLPYACYSNCDNSTAPILNVTDFICFLNKYAAGDPYANCDGSTLTPTLNVTDFICFLNKYAAGCP